MGCAKSKEVSKKSSSEKKKESKDSKSDKKPSLSDIPGMNMNQADGGANQVRILSHERFMTADAVSTIAHTFTQYIIFDLTDAECADLTEPAGSRASSMIERGKRPRACAEPTRGASASNSFTRRRAKEGGGRRKATSRGHENSSFMRY